MINPWVAARTFLIVSESPKTFSYLKKGLLFNLQNCNFESKITCWISDKTNGPVLRSFCSAYSMGYSILPPHSIFCLNWDDHVFRSINLQIVFFFSDSAVIVLVKNSIPGRLLFYMNAKSIFCINTHYLYTNLRIHHGSIYAHYRKVGINYRSIGTSSCDWTKNVMSCVSCFYRKLKFLFDSRPFCNFDSAYSLFCRKKPVTILANKKRKLFKNIMQHKRLFYSALPGYSHRMKQN